MGSEGVFHANVSKLLACAPCLTLPSRPYTMNPEYPSNHPENDSPLFSYDWVSPCSTQPSTFDFPANSLSGHGELATRDRPNRKVQIPRIAHSGNWTTSGRVSRACKNCREQKTKCSGDTPACDRCKDAGIRCSYGDRKGEKIAKWVASDEATAHL